MDLPTDPPRQATVGRDEWNRQALGQGDVASVVGLRPTELLRQAQSISHKVRPRQPVGALLSAERRKLSSRRRSAL